MYKLIEWTDDLRVGITELDEHHKILVSLINELHSAIHRRQGLGQCRAILLRLSRFADVHFALEEGFLRGEGSEQREDHRNEHRELVHEIDALLERIDTLHATVNFHRLHKLKIWLLRHILSTDKNISRYRRRDEIQLEARRQRLARLGT